MIRWLGMFVALGLVSAVQGEEPKKGAAPGPADMMKAMEAMTKPGPEHQKLEPLVGVWNYTCKIWMDPSKPPMESTGTIERKWILGKRFLEEKVSGTNFDGKPGFEGCGVMGYDNAQKKFTTGWVCTMCTSISTGLGTCDASGTKFTFQKEAFCPIRNKKISGREELRLEGKDKCIMESYEVEDGKDKKIMEITAVRVK